MIFAITNRHLLEREDLLERVEFCLRSGIEFIMLREKDYDDTSLLALAQEVKALTDRYGGYLIINNNLKVARSVEAYGVQLSMEAIHEGIEFSGKIGASVHSYDEARKAIRCGVDYLLTSHIFPTECKPGLKAKGIELIQSIRTASSIKIIALNAMYIALLRNGLQT